MIWYDEEEIRLFFFQQIQMQIQNPVKPLSWSFLQKYLTGESR